MRARRHHLPAGVRSTIAAAAIRAADGTKWAALRSYPMFTRTASLPLPAWVDVLGARGALRAALHAYRRVPAYRDFVDASGWRDDRSLTGVERLSQLPVMDKQNYITPYPTAARCLDGRIPLRGTEMDESSGSSGTPYNWVRGPMELDEVHRQLSMFASYMFREEIVTINAFSMGAWSTGVNAARALARNGLVKSPGPDRDKVLDTIAYLGAAYPYVVTGYPPFLRELLDYGDARGFDWRPYRLYGVVGGEGMSEQLRDRLLTRFIAVYSAYGASDLDIGVAAETPLSIFVRRAAGADTSLRRALFGDDPRLPMVFQYNPLDYHVETIGGELVVTVSRLCMLSPRIRYNIHDAGGSHGFDHVAGVFADFGIDLLGGAEPPSGGRHFRFPFLFVHGRSDSTLSYMGANIYPEDVEQGLLQVAALAERLGAFCLEMVDQAGGTARPCVHLEVSVAGADGGALRDAVRRAVVERLVANSRDYRSAVAENPEAAELLVEFHAPGTGPFSENERRIKRRYIVRDAT